MAQTQRPFSELELRSDFVSRHIGPDEAEVEAMLGTLGIGSLGDLVKKAVPAAILSDEPLDLEESQPEAATLARLRKVAGKNRVMTSMIGMGYSDTVTPGVVLRNVLENPGWYTAYTPYQPEISQGRLEALLNFQTMIMDLTGMEIANASMLDEGTAAAEAMTLCQRVSKSKSNAFFVANDCHPQTIAIVQTRSEPLGIELIMGDPADGPGDKEVFGALLQYPATDGGVRDYAGFIKNVHGQGGLAVVAADLLSLVLLTPPGEFGADVVVGSAQRFGVPMGFGGPHAAFFATKDSHKRSMPGRIVGVSVDSRSRPGLRLALQTREQHIRRDKATSNICTAQVLLAVMASMYAVYHGPNRIRAIAERINRLAGALAAGLKDLGFEVTNESWFDTLTVKTPGSAGAIHERAEAAGINLRHIDGDTVSIACDEVTTPEIIGQVLDAFAGKASGLDFAALDKAAKAGVPGALTRKSAFLGHAAFNSYHSETEMLRYLRKLQSKDVALVRSMIPLGSCTMKLNATSEMIPVTWPEFGRIHPYAPRDQVQGYLHMIQELESWLAEITGYDAVSLQPNAGSQGEYAGLLAIRAWHKANGDEARKVCLIPSSAHGTNPASAILCGMKVVVVECDKDGNIDVEDLKAKAAEHKDTLAALMITYPSTHGVFEEAVVEICKIIHDHGGQVYLDGANLNAQVGVCKPGVYGSDVSHLNLHKTFCIPHGGGGPGVGPIGVGKHLAPFLPGTPVGGEFPHSGAPVAAAPYGSASILPITWAYIAMMGRDGLRRATEVAILSANYIATRLQEHYPVLYTGHNGLVAHECIIDLRQFKQVSVDDVAKRLMDYGFHAPTMSFPVAGTLMIEPTESESKVELDRFCDAMIAIRKEIAAVEEGKIDAANNPLANAPHTLEDLISDTWDRPYSRDEAAFPVATLRDDKYWPPVNRVDNVYGDRNLVCDCPGIDQYREAAE